jgi:hypothetical protein
VVVKTQAVLSEAELLRAMFDVEYFSPNTPPPDRQALIKDCRIAGLHLTTVACGRLNVNLMF